MSERVARARARRFVGREMEVALFQAALTAPEPPFAVLHVCGPGGVGKTTLLHEFGRRAAAAGRAVTHLDGRHLEPSPAALEAGLPPAGTGRPLLLIDTYEIIAALDGWLRAALPERLPADALVVIAGRHQPTAWLGDGGWAELTRVVRLGNLPAAACRAYLALRGVPPEHHAAVLEFTRGHPLALSLLADHYGPRGGPAPGPVTSEREVLRVLLERLLRDVPSTEHRHALELSAICRTTTEALLAHLFGRERAFALFRWLRQLSFMEQGPYGLYPHDLVREVLEADLHWRNPARYSELQEVALAHLYHRAVASRGAERQRLGIDIMYTERRAPGMEPFFVWDALDTAYAEPIRPDDGPAIIGMVRRHEGEASAAIAAHWLSRQPEAFLLFRTPADEPYGFMTRLELHRATPEDIEQDPAAAAVLAYVQQVRPIAPGEAITLLRFWMAAGSYQEISPAINLTAANCVIQWTTLPRLCWSFVAMANPEFMTPHFESIRFPRTPEADYEVGGRRYGVFRHDWMADPLDAWMVDTRHSSPDGAPPTPVLDEAAFDAAVRQALRDLTRVDLLAKSPLRHDPLLDGTARTVEDLRERILEAVASLQHHPQDAKLYRALVATYVEPAGTQEQAAEQLDLPFNTYRYHLARGQERLVAWLWRTARSEA